MLNELILHTVETQREDSVCACVACACVCVCGRDNVDDGTSRGQLLGFSYFCYLHVLLVNLATYLKKKKTRICRNINYDVIDIIVYNTVVWNLPINAAYVRKSP